MAVDGENAVGNGMDTRLEFKRRKTCSEMNSPTEGRGETEAVGDDTLKALWPVAFPANNIRR